MRLIASFLLVTSVASAQLSQPATTRLPGGAVRVTNTGPSRWMGTSGWKLELERTITPEEGSPGMLARPRSMAVSDKGQIVVSDFAPKGLLLFGPDGKFVRLIGGIGSGPGEFSQGPSIAMRGDTIAAVTDSRALAWRTDGTLITQWTVTNSRSTVAIDEAGRVLLGTTLPGPFPGIPGIVKYRFNGTPVDTIAMPRRVQMKAWRTAGGGLAAVPFRATDEAAFNPKAEYVHGFGDTYEIVRSPRIRDTTMIVAMPGQRARVAESLRDSMVQRIQSNRLLKDVARPEDIPVEHPFFTGLQLDEKDNIWVSRPDARGVTSAFDVIDPQGSFLGTVPAPPAMRQAPVFANGRMYRFAENADGIPVIEVYRINKGRY
jgi:hypothetical protein